MDGLHPQARKGQQRPCVSRVGGTSGKDAPPRPHGATNPLPTAPNTKLDADLVRHTLGSGAATSRGALTSSSAPIGRHANSSTIAVPHTVAQQPFDMYVVLDFEATCERNQRIPEPEVIEFPFVLVDATTGNVVAEFQHYVRPVRHPRLSDFCTELTGISQAMVQDRTTFPAVYREALAFLEAAGLGDAPPLRSYCVVTCGDWDLKTMLPAQMRISGQLRVPLAFQRWCNLKTCMARLPLNVHGSQGSTATPTQRRSSTTPSGLPEMLHMVGLTLKGRHHSGIDDCRNIAAVLGALLQRGFIVDATYEPTELGLPRWHASAVDADDGQLVAPLPPLHSLKSSIAAGPQVAPTPAKKTADVPVPDRPVLLIDTQRNALKELLEGVSNSSPSVAVASPSDRKAVSKFLSSLLRHNADKWQVPMCANGFVRVEDALRQPQMTQRNVTVRDLAELVHESDKQRFQLAYGAVDGKLYIAATQGHSLPGVEPELRRHTTAAEVPMAVHGTYYEAWRAIQKCGYLSTMNRQHIHFAKGLVHDGDVISGMRVTVQVFVYLDVSAALADGVPVFESSNGVVLTPGVGETRQLPLKYVSKVVDRRTGVQLYPSKESAP